MGKIRDLPNVIWGIKNLDRVLVSRFLQYHEVSTNLPIMQDILLSHYDHCNSIITYMLGTKRKLEEKCHSKCLHQKH